MQTLRAAQLARPRILVSRSVRMSGMSSLVEDAAAPPGPRIYTRKDGWRVWPPRTPDNSWNGFVGNWHCDIHDPKEYTVVQTLRTWRPRDASRSVWDQTNVYSAARPGSSLRDSPADGLHQKPFEYPVDRTTFDSPVDTGVRGLVVTVDGSTLIHMGGFNLPPIALGAAPPAAAPPPAAAAAGSGAPAAAAAGGGGGAGGATAVGPIGPSSRAGGPAAGPPPVWGFEIFLHDGPCRWSLVLLYSTHTGELAKVTFVQEYDTHADPATPHVLAAAAADGSIRTARPQLNAADPSRWLSGGALNGKVVSRLWAAEPVAAAGTAAAAEAVAGARPGSGGVVRQLMVDESLQELVTWGAASSLPSTSLLVLPLPDSMYLRAPASLKDLRQQQQQQAAVAGSVAAFEFGGLLRSVEGGLQRVVVRYDAAAADGGFVEATREVFVP
ncbi:hypothetical protein CHLRE_02g113950v5 [Chlamydomonas reinhardtii]|uniref:Uncharacterized protein n=1 Tax=Chlamydomonas reinhardtii TaxID=3055 RepID=A0A2K3E364_CHLRE|nr:uncharacterized protein CHLRE_02g113950v5 [Chlamydomonas reinhardtii]PNW87225.1 hypothetical protein CHLRE_02g113950v5 [Chlamydomonas reinhardtii]